jgi:hypothetical protein
MSERLILLLTESEGKEPCVHIYRGDFESVLESFKNCSSTTTGDRAKMTLLDIQYDEEPVVEMWVKDLPRPIMRVKKEGYKLGKDAPKVPEKKQVKKKLLERVKKWLLKLIQ